MEKRIILNNLETPFWIDSTGRLRNENNNHWLKGGTIKGYHFYNVFFKGKQYTLYTHRLVAEYFLPNPDPENFNIVHHKDGNKLNNNLSNLEWMSVKEHNNIHAQRHFVQKIYIDNEEINISELKQFRDSPYYASKDGQIYNLDKNIKMRFENSGNYFRVQCQYNLNGKHFQVHRIVYECFKGPIPKGQEINHIDGNPHNNNIDNLELVTHTDNCKKAYHNNIRVYSKNIETGEEKHYSSTSEASRQVLGYRDGRKIPKAIEEKELFKNCYWYYEE